VKEIPALRLAGEDETEANAATKAADANLELHRLEDVQEAAKDRAEQKKATQERRAKADTIQQACAQANAAEKAQKAVVAAAKVLKRKKPAKAKFKVTAEEQYFAPPGNIRANKIQWLYSFTLPARNELPTTTRRAVVEEKLAAA